MIPSRVSRFAVIGVCSTLLYAAIALVFMNGRGADASTSAVSVAAYAAAAVFSYAGHKYFTFVSAGRHRLEAPRFLAVTLVGLLISFLLSAVLSDSLGLPPQAPVALTCLIVPIFNYFVLDHWVFAARMPTDSSVKR